ncbi:MULTISPECIES: 3-deoxy-D-manno-octulosonic acid kinase [unclassified Lysobacter]|uniref:3-deoxy-D-manno-octulosonic acid kinase n=1 Tax=unclassified Lysobacter TaxID=2635362 RepID=UPI001BE89F14|nr:MULTISPECIES: 3-deoxy-D-manno-octulosonic acid kinase [unclassified Lysobacter]MBT2747158.1 3-deoxy-D-manno-octulosonic acid kinase [Lysobacter sp. ISL-42]MBT2752964.1 3-deoxy-D-manno-octulosonic acid kinase [Lysobacter sp. ISL-50]MBT2778875.1 3-deoxy-D-manno-octulosonic acid kinase [Lysobacter sp. ISL-54]MBT2784231.1 3-deoxy-D-manno-octulosonic acid kinase [Lysobacter sp. ISL-52]
MTGYDAAEGLTPYRDDSGYGAILFDRERVQQAVPEWFSPAHWGEQARPVDSGGRGGAWFVDAPFGQAVLRRYLRGGLVARFNRDRYWWRGANLTRSFAEFRLTRQVARKGLPVPMPIAAWYRRDGLHYYAAILIERLNDVRSLADRAAVAGDGAPWEETGRLIARCHRAGLDHADLNATNLLFDTAGRGWVIDLDRGAIRIPATAWRERNLARLKRSLLKLRGSRGPAEVERDFARLRAAYDRAWERGY